MPNSRLIGLAAVTALVWASAGLAQESKPLPEWKDHMARLGAIQDDVVKEIYKGDDPQQRQEAWSLMMGQLARIYLVHVYTDPDYPEFVPLYNSGLNIAAPNPDYIYYGTELDGAGTYRLRGIKGTNRFTFLQFSSRRMGDRRPDGANASISLEGFALDDVPSAKDGTFDFILSPERPAGYAGHWQKLDPRTQSMFMRAASYNWLVERDPVVGIERLDRPARRGRPSAQEIATKMAALPDFVRHDSLLWWRHMQDLQKRDMWNRIGEEPWGTFPGQIYLEGLYKLADDEALLIETDVPKNCRYWAFLVGDMQFRTGDWVNHQASLNAFQARLDSDGKFRAAIAKSDPGVPNWLDTAGFSEGVIQGRWNVCDSKPIPTARLVKLAQLRQLLPKDTPVVTPEQRDQVLRDRRLGSQMRRKW